MRDEIYWVHACTNIILYTHYRISENFITYGSSIGHYISRDIAFPRSESTLCIYSGQICLMYSTLPQHTP